MKEATKDEFYKAIGDLDVVSNVIGDFPFTTEFRMRNGPLKGKIVERLGKDDEDYTVRTFYLISL